LIENLAITEKTPSELEGVFFCSSCLAIGNATGNTALSSSWSELDIVPGLFGDLLLRQCSAHLVSSRIADSGQIGLMPGRLIGELLAIAPILHLQRFAIKGLALDLTIRDPPYFAGIDHTADVLVITSISQGVEPIACPEPCRQQPSVLL